ncbi:hypothetical protein SAMN04487928_13028 [Butyrivibrio proteoclasticus]|uniref:DUF3021 domain-containing protein n=1 Tax=Butyrivibrio proteoclasticus TaxID=43305 RepID=A0A1I5XBW4_9FIRM|nr:DUF6608 family protein [Butyrivibrio proteoclasticus]SFQ29469.1 hypothetical protein SAMN04487928_13028 [Butyrivibrio proteoclasticus]
MKEYFKNLALMIFMSYTVVSVSSAVINIIFGGQTNNMNELMMLAICIIASVVLSLHRLFDSISPLAMMVIQYLLACVLIAVMLLIVSHFDTITIQGWLDLYRSFTIPYVILAGVYYYSVFADTKKKDSIIKDLQKRAG